MTKSGVCILGIYVADLAFRADRQPEMGETIMGSSFMMGPGGKGSNQSVAAARSGGKVTFISKLGRDDFGTRARAMFAQEKIEMCIADADVATGAAYIFVSDKTGDNAIIVVPGAAGLITKADVDENRNAITSSKIFMTQLETPIEVGHHALEIAHAAGVTTILNTAPAARLDDAIYRICDYVTPNESEAALLTGIEVNDINSAKRAGDVFLKKGVGTALLTLGARGALLHNTHHSIHIPAFTAGEIIDTTGAGDAFNGGFATALSEGKSPEHAALFGSATAGISVTRKGTAPSMPTRIEIEALLKRE